MTDMQVENSKRKNAKMFPGGRMNKRILLVLAVLLSLFACSTNAANKAEKVEKSELATKVAILPLK